MPRRSKSILTPRKSPVQARSAASVDAILQATIQVLLQVGKNRLTTTRVASRAGVSVGTLYQYFPNKSAVLQAALKRHLDEVAKAVERVCQEQKDKPLSHMATALINTFIEAKMRKAKTSVAMYSVSSDVDGARIVREMGVRINKAIAVMLSTASEPLTTDPHLVAGMLQDAMTGVSRRLLEPDVPEKHFEALRQELVFFACAYLEARSKTATLPPKLADRSSILCRTPLQSSAGILVDHLQQLVIHCLLLLYRSAADGMGGAVRQVIAHQCPSYRA